jgi:hypothetical protein
MNPDAPYETTLATVSAGRAAAVAQLRGLADRLERLALSDVAEILILLEPVLANHCICPVDIGVSGHCPLACPLNSGWPAYGWQRGLLAPSL